jgi:Ran GTPase-activating protein (RanGAP) involved in mRNA processing and transport
MSNIELVDKIIKDLIPYLKNLNLINYINISLNNLSHKSLEYLEEIISLQPFLEHIILDQNAFGNEGIISLSKGLKKVDNLKSFSAFFNQIKTDGIDKLSNEIKRYKNLYYLNLSTNYIFYEEIDELVSAIKYMNNLIELNLSNNQISSEGLCFIGEILPKTIQKLNVSENEIYQDGFSEFGSYLSRIPNLTSLIIYGNRNGPSGIN